MTSYVSRLFLFFAFLSILNSCKKEIQMPATEEEPSSAAKTKGHLKQAKTFSSDVITSWIDMQLMMLKTPLAPGTRSQASDRCQAYCGIAAYEAVVNGMPAYQSLSGQLKDFPVMPVTEPGEAIHWAASANAALAEMNRKLFPATADVFKTKMNQLEESLNVVYATEVSAVILQRSIAFGKAVATEIFKWAAADGFANINPPYAPPVGPGIWVLTSPTPAVNAYAYQRRLMVPGSNIGTALEPLPPYSTDPSSAFYALNKAVYDASFTLTDDQKRMADYFKDNPGYSPGGGFVWVLSESLKISRLTLDNGAIAYAKVGMAQHEATIVLNTDKYKWLIIRPITYIKAVIDPNWKTYIPTPNHPEFPSGHATTNGAVLSMMSNMFGENFPITMHTYDYLGYLPRHYDTFTAMGRDMADSRFYGGLHYKETCEKSIAQGKKVAENILNTIKFLK